MNTAQIVRWRCGNCGLANSVSQTECPSCGGSRPSRNPDGGRLLSATLLNEGNENVQNNINNVAVHGDVHLGNFFTQSIEEDETEEQSHEPRPPSFGRSFLYSFMMTTCGVAIWMATLTMGCFVVFFGTIFVKAFLK